MQTILRCFYLKMIWSLIPSLEQTFSVLFKRIINHPLKYNAEMCHVFGTKKTINIKKSKFKIVNRGSFIYYVRKIFQKIRIPYLLTRTHTCAHQQGVKC